MIDWAHLVSGNQFVSGGFLLIMFGGALASLKSIPGNAWAWMKRRVLYTVEIDNSDSAHSWLKTWIAANAKARWLGAGVRPNVDPNDGNDKKKRPKFHLWPMGFCRFRYRGRRVFAWIDKEPLQVGTGYRETITLRCIGDGRELFASLLGESYEHAAGLHGEVIEVWAPDGYANWALVDRKRVRSPDTLSIPDGVAEAVFGRAKQFRKQREWYASRGVPWRLGFLLKGPPGNGKSSCVHVLASELRCNISVVSVSAISDDTKLIEMLARSPQENILLLEDVDCVFRERKAGTTHKVTLSGLLNALDGVCAGEGRITVMTTNHPDTLDPALIRPGRCDVHVELGNANKRQAREMYERFFPGYEKWAGAFASAVPAETSMAAIQAHLLRFADDASGAMAWAAQVAEKIAA